MEARICPDGSAVGRSGPNCEFAPCSDLAVIEGLEQGAVEAISGPSIATFFKKPGHSLPRKKLSRSVVLP